MSECPTDEQLAGYARHACEGAEKARISEHVETCARCQRWLDDEAANEALWRDVGSEQAPLSPVGEDKEGAGPEQDSGKTLTRPPQIEGYSFVREIHRGGQGIVFQAVQESTKRKVAIKVLLQGPYASATASKRFEREVELVALLKHPNIVTVFDFGTTEDGHSFCAMDYVRGMPLDRYVREKRPTFEQALKLFRAVCDAVQYAHQKGIIHRDLKPSNILVDTEGVPKVVDFGLAKQLAAPLQTVVSFTGQVVGTLPYMSPEQAGGNPDEIDTRTDVYALGVILYEILTGHYPYPVVGQMAEVLNHIANTPPTPPTQKWTSASGVHGGSTRKLRPETCPITDDTQTIVLRALAKERERRYQSAGELARDIEHYLAGEPIEARRDSRMYILRKTLAHYKRHALVASFSLILVVSLVFLSLSLRGEKELAVKAREAAELRLERQREAETLVADAARLIERRERLSDAMDNLDQAIQLSDGNENAYLQRGLLKGIMGLEGRLEDKQKLAREAARDFRQAHLVAAKSDLDTPPDGTAPAHSGSSISGVALLSGANILALADLGGEAAGYFEQASAFIRYDVSTPRQDRTVAPLRVYDCDHDRMIVSQELIGRSPEVANKVPDTDATLTVALPRSVSTLKPSMTPRAPDSYVRELLFERLFRKSRSSEIVVNPVLVETAELRPDGITWDLVLRPGVTWHDGHPFTAADVVFSWEHYSGNEPVLLSVVAEGEHRVSVVHKKPVSTAKWDMMFPINPKHLFAEGGADGRFGTEPVGNGPYRIRFNDSSNRIVLERWDDYTGERPYFRQIVFEVLPDRNERLTAVARGRIDAVELTSGEFGWMVNGASFGDGLAKLASSANGYEAICWNADGSNPFFEDPRVRQAMTLAINLDYIRERFGGLTEPAIGIYPKDSWMFNADVARMEFAPAKAEDLLDEAGWTRAEEIGEVRSKDGDPFEFALMVPEGAPTFRSLAGEIQLDLQRIGVRMRVDAVPTKTWAKRRDAHDFEACAIAVVSAAHPDREQSRWRSDGGVKNYGGYANSEVDELYNRAHVSTDVDEQTACYRKIQALIYDDQPYTFLWRRPTLWAFSSEIRGVTTSSQGVWGFYPGLRAWWKPADGT